MIKYIDRQNTDCFKWDGLYDTFGEEGLLPLWVADMDFELAGCITGAINDYFARGIPGYYRVPESYYEAFIAWETAEHGLTVDRDQIRFAPGVVAGVNWLVQLLTDPGDAVAIMTPVYYPFKTAVTNNDRKLVCSELLDTAAGYRIDFDDLENQIAEEDVRLLILCSPHNPVSRVWHRDELQTLLEICRRHDVMILSDEIHHDLIFGGAKHIPLLSLTDDRDKVIMLTSASKTFNIAGLQNSIIVIPDQTIRARWDAFVKGLSVGSGNSLGYIASEAAWRDGKDWLEEVRAVIYGNYLWLKNELAAHLPKTRVIDLEGTYLCWIDLGAYVPADEIVDVVQHDCRLAVDFGEWFENNTPSTFIRINLATSRENIEEAAGRLIERLVK